MGSAVKRRTSERGRQAEIDAARAREVEEERLAEAERAREAAEEALHVAHQRSSEQLPPMDRSFVQRQAKVVREYVRAVIVPDAIRRLYDIGMGVARFETFNPLGVVVELEAPAATQRQALMDLVTIGVPKLRGAIDGEGSPLVGVLVMGGSGLHTARALAAEHRAAEVGHAIGPGPPVAYVPPPGHEVQIIEDDLSNPASSSASPDDPPLPPPRKLTKAQEIARRRRQGR